MKPRVNPRVASTGLDPPLAGTSTAELAAQVCAWLLP